MQREQEKPFFANTLKTNTVVH